MGGRARGRGTKLKERVSFPPFQYRVSAFLRVSSQFPINDLPGIVRADVTTRDNIRLDAISIAPDGIKQRGNYRRITIRKATFVFGV